MTRILALLLMATSANAQASNCASRAHIVERLASKYGETRQSIGLGANNQAVELFASPDTGTWTIVVTNANGVSCLVASGTAWEATRTPSAPMGGRS